MGWCAQKFSVLDVMPIWDTCSPMDRHRQGSVTA